jgi:hypothetical protein
VKLDTDASSFLMRVMESGFSSYAEEVVRSHLILRLLGIPSFYKSFKELCFFSSIILVKVRHRLPRTLIWACYKKQNTKSNQCKFKHVIIS